MSANQARRRMPRHADSVTFAANLGLVCVLGTVVFATSDRRPVTAVVIAAAAACDIAVSLFVIRWLNRPDQTEAR